MLKEACGAISGMMIQQGLKRMALFTMLAFSTYMRLVEPRTLRTLDVVPAVADAAHNFSCTVLLLSPSERDSPSTKTGGYDETVLLNDTRMPYLGLQVESLMIWRPEESGMSDIGAFGDDGTTLLRDFAATY